MITLKVGDVAPDFTGTTERGEQLTLSSMRGRRIILYFYPKDNTPGCTFEAKNLRDGRTALQAQGFDIVGVSPDNVTSHLKFCEQHSLTFPLIADTSHRIAKLYGVWGEKSFMGRTGVGILRTTFIIDADGVIERIFDKVDTKNHWQQILDSYKQTSLFN